MTDWDDTAVAVPGEVAESARDDAFLVVVRGADVGKTFLVAETDMVVGRAASVDLRLDDEGVSRVHCRIRRMNGFIVVEDLGSRNGTFCNGERVADGPRKLAEGDRVQVGTTSVLRFTFVEQQAEPPRPDDRQSTMDLLTGAFSRRYFLDQLKALVGVAIEKSSALSLLLVHIDRYDDISATHGPEAADQLTVSVTDCVREKLRDNKDIMARIDRGDLGILSRATSPGDTFMLAERVKTSALNVKGPAVNGRPITLSLGVASIHELTIRDAKDFLLAAGIALSRARAQGGNRAVLCTQDLLQDQQQRSTV